MQYVCVLDEQRLLEELRHPGSAILCGGTDLVVKMRAGIARPERLVDIGRIDSLQGVRAEGDRLWIGATTSEDALLAHSLIRDRFPLLTETLSKLGSVQIRCRGTLGGNLVNASPAADTAIPLLLYDAEVELVGSAGARCLPVRDFLLAPGRTALVPGEYVRAVVLPVDRRPWIPFFHKVGKRRALTISIASLGGLATLEDKNVREIRLAAGSVAPTACRLPSVEALLRGQRLDETLIERARAAAAAAVSPIDDVRASAAYRRDVIGRLVARFLERLLSA